MEMTLKDYEINKSKILEFLHGIKYTGLEFVQLLKVDVPEITFLVFNYNFFLFLRFQILYSIRLNFNCFCIYIISGEPATL